LRRSNNDIIIGCYSSQQTWQLKCDGRQWKGLVGTCPEFCKSKLREAYVRSRLSGYFTDYQCWVDSCAKYECCEL